MVHFKEQRTTIKNAVQNSRFLVRIRKRCRLPVVATTQPGRAVAQAVSRWLPTAAARIRVQAACGVCGGQSGTGAGFLSE
jgi:ribosomal protein S14